MGILDPILYILHIQKAQSPSCLGDSGLGRFQCRAKRVDCSIDVRIIIVGDMNFSIACSAVSTVSKLPSFSYLFVSNQLVFPVEPGNSFRAFYLSIRVVETYFHERSFGSFTRNAGAVNSKRQDGSIKVSNPGGLSDYGTAALLIRFSNWVHRQVY